MALRTHLELVNKVLVNLRETPVTALNSAYPMLISQYVNQAKEKVEDQWQWRSLATTAVFDTALGQQDYFLDGMGTPLVAFTPDRPATERSFLLRDSYYQTGVVVMDANSARELCEEPFEGMVEEYRVPSQVVYGAPTEFSYTVEEGKPVLWLDKPPDGVYTIQVRLFTPQPELVAATDPVIAPWRPIVSLATFLAMQERGEELGTQADIYLAAYQDEVARAITNDVGPEQLHFRVD